MTPIVIINDFGYVNGGTAQIAIGDALALARNGYKVVFFCAVGPPTLALGAADVRVICLDQNELAIDPNRMRAAVSGLWNVRATKKLSNLLAGLGPNPIVHLHGWSKALSSSIMPVALRHGARLVLSLHDYFAACPNGGFYQFPQGRVCDLTAMSPSCIACNCDPRNYPQKLYRVLRQFVQQKAGLPGGIEDFIVHSQLAQRLLLPYLPAGARLHHLPPAIEIEKASPVFVSGNRHFLMVGRLSPEKGPLLFARAAELAGVPAVFAGDGRMRDAILAQLPKAEVTGWLDRHGVLKQLHRARALVFPSLLYETFGLTVAEALALGIPTIVPYRSAAAELIEDGKTGLLFRAGDAADLASKMKILKDGDLAAAMGQRAYRDYWLSPLTPERHLEAMEALYGRMAG